MDDSLVEVFLEEVNQIMGDLQQALLNLEEHYDVDTFNSVLRALHNIKGTSKAIGFVEIGDFIHHLETLVLTLKDKGPLGRQITQTLLEATDLVMKAVSTPNVSSKADFDRILHQLESWLAETHTESQTDFSATEDRPSAHEPETPHDDCTSSESLIPDGIITDGQNIWPSRSEFEEDTPSDNLLSDSLTSSSHPTSAPSSEEANLFSHDMSRQDLISIEHTPPIQAETDSILQAEEPKTAEGEEREHLQTQTGQSLPSESSHQISLPTQPPPSNTSPAQTPAQAPKTQQSLRVSIDKIEALERCIGEMLIQQDIFLDIAKDMPPQTKRSIFNFLKLIKQAQELTGSLRMIPLTQTYQRLDRIARETAALLNKKVKVEFLGEHTEVDKVLIEKMVDPLVHIIRNAIDHGIESSEVRQSRGKNPTGWIRFNTMYRGDRLIFIIQDDGGGIDTERLKQKAIEKQLFKNGIIPQKEEELNQLIFHPGLSTKEQVSEVSGRGVGMDVVRRNIEEARGHITVRSQKGQGSLFEISLPLTLSVLEALLIRADQDFFFLPLSDVSSVLNFDPSLISSWKTTGEILTLRQKNYRVMALSDFVGHKKKNTPDSVIITKTQNEEIALLVDEIIGRQQIYIKPLPEEMKTRKIFSGLTILRNGQLAFVLETSQFQNRRYV